MDLATVNINAQYININRSRIRQEFPIVINTPRIEIQQEARGVKKPAMHGGGMDIFWNLLVVPISSTRRLQQRESNVLSSLQSLSLTVINRCSAHFCPEMFAL